ncbi:TetR/AcrR family transcriptional regulator [Mycolicibacter sp. MYC123]|uniref:TetR/AcrR family transcriptional regulator n=1 Tax=[Mycobacterium] zoologicum TaxID=2872311 RepID=A0ABU5YRQ7_9MYCO|nr:MULTISPECIES: TetR/AcrR family transcriptional regulator [unclassified Mycolicibacter]MEB3052435.1 TetR/AcrR family transcriptional regulator [Mycolicibacter sp. MYC123]MEB3062214.1 TetR/AcrR family transcriptional regulator [Mycolicibacter sp. MYC101]
MVDPGDFSNREQTWVTGGAWRRRRLSESDLRERILGSAVAMLTESGGLTVSMAHLNMEELIRIADVPRSSVYRAWGSKEAFYVELMERMVAPGPEGSYADDVVRIARRVLDQSRQLLGTAQGRRAVLEEMVRSTVTQSFHGAARSLAWRSFTALAVAVPTLDDEDQQRILAAMAASHARIIDRVAEVYTETLPLVGMRMKAGFDIRTAIATGSATMDGLIRLGFTDPATVASVILKPGLDGEPVEWELPPLAFLAILDAMIEPDPEFPA